MNKTIIWSVVVALALAGIIVYVKVSDRSPGQSSHESNQSSHDASQPSYDVGNQKASKHKHRKIPYGVTSDSPEATKAGMKVLKNGGNAADAAIAVSYTLAVTDIYGSGLGGGGLMIVDSPKKDPVEYDYQVTAPKYGDMPNNDVGVPGFVAGMQRVHKELGSVKMKKLIQPSVNAAKNGFKVSSILHNRARLAKARIGTENDVIYPDGKAVEAGTNLKQPKLAHTLRKIQSHGSAGFYKGKIGRKIADNVDGFRTKDLTSYKALKKKPAKGKFAGVDVYTTDQVGGGIPMIQTLQLAEHEKLDKKKDHSAAFVKQLGDINHQVYEDKIHKLGDPDFADVPSMDKLVSDQHMDHMARKMKKQHFPKGKKDKKSDNKDTRGNTTHFVVVDKDGMMVSATNTLSNFFGSGQRVAGVFLNNELRLFSDRKSSPNYPAPGKRPTTYVAPAILAKDGAPLIGIGSAGGGRIPPVISQVLMRTLKFDMAPQEAVNEPRSMVEANNGTISLEKDFPDRSKLFDEFGPKGYTIDKVHSNDSSYFGSVQTIAVDYAKDDIHIGRDDRREGKGDKSK